MIQFHQIFLLYPQLLSGLILKQLPLDLTKTEDAFSKDLLLLMLKQYKLFLDSFQFACKNYKGNTKEADIAKVMGFESNDEYNEIMFLREMYEDSETV